MWSIVNGTEIAPTDAKNIDWESIDEKAKSIIGLALSNSELHHVDFKKSSKQIWDGLTKLFGAKATTAKFSLKFQLFSFKMSNEITMSNHISNLWSLIKQLAEVSLVIDKDDTKAILLNSLPSKYSNVVFTLSQMSS